LVGRSLPVIIGEIGVLGDGKASAFEEDSEALRMYAP
jgi:hypothetical protein